MDFWLETRKYTPSWPQSSNSLISIFVLPEKKSHPLLLKWCSAWKHPHEDSFLFSKINCNVWFSLFASLFWVRLFFKKTWCTLALQASATTCSSTVVLKKSGHSSFDIKEPHGVESYTVERTQLIMGCAGPREDVNCSIITTSGQGKRVMESQLI